MKTAEVPTTQKAFCDMVKNADGGTVIITKRGRALAALVPLEVHDSEIESLSNSPKFQDIVKKSLQELEQGNWISHEEMKRRLGMAPALRRRRVSKTA